MKVFEKTVEGISYISKNGSFKVKNLVIRSSYKAKFGTVSITDEENGVLLQVPMQDLIELINKAKENNNET